MSAATSETGAESTDFFGTPTLLRAKASQPIFRRRRAWPSWVRFSSRFPLWVPIVLVGCFLVVIAQPLRAQTFAASVTGTVTDPSGAVVPGARVTMTNVSNGFAYTAITNGSGIYVVLNLRPDTYTLTVSAKGFRTYSRRGITLVVNQAANVNVRLEVGSSVQTVQVNAAPPVLDTQNGQLGQTVTGSLIRELPLVGRDVQELISLAPGVTPAPGGACTVCGSGGSFNVVSYGMRNDLMDITLDGVTTAGPDFEIHDQEFSPNLEDVQEFKIEQNNFSADKGFSGSTVVTMVTRSGTNQFHGKVYEFDRNDMFDSNNFFSNESGTPIPPLHWNDFGGTFGGPIKRNKAFFFFDYDGSRTSTLSVHSFGVPTKAEIAGDFSSLCGMPNGPAPGATFNAQGMCSNPNGQLWDPYSGFLNSQGNVVRNAIIPFNNMATYQSPGADLAGTGLSLPAVAGNVINPTAQKLMEMYPAPNVGVPGSPSYNPYDNFLSSGANSSSGNQYDVKIDYMVNDTTHLWGRFSYDWGKSVSAMCWDNAADPCGSGPTTNPPYSGQIVLNVSHNFGPNKLLNLTYGFTRGGWVDPGEIAADFPNFNAVTALGMPAYINDDKGIKGTPAISVNTSSPYLYSGQPIGQLGWIIADVGRENHDVLGSLDWLVGRHDIKFGGEFRALRDNSWGPGVPNSDEAFDQFGSTSQNPTTGGDFMAGLLSGVSTDGWGQYEIDAAPAELNKNFSGFIEDNWRTTSKLTLNIGLRYDLQFPQTERHNMLNYFNPAVASPLSGKVPAIAQSSWTFTNNAGNTVPMTIPIPNLNNLYGADEFVGVGGNSRWWDPSAYYDGWQPRVGLAYQINSKTVLRAAFAKFFSWYQYGSGSYGVAGDGFTQLTYPTNTFQGNGYTPSAPLSNPYPSGPLFPTGSSLGALTNVGLTPTGPFDSPGWQVIPSSWNWNFGLQRDLPGNVLLEANYVGMKGTHLMYGGYVSPNYLGPAVGRGTPSQIADRVAQLNTYVPNPFYGVNGVSSASPCLSGPTVPASQLELPYPQYCGMNFVEPPWANSEYNGLEIRTEKRLSKGLEFVASYVWSKSIDNASAQGDNTTWLGGFLHLRDPNNRNLERGLSEFDLPQSFQLSYVYQLPFGQGMHWGSHWNGVVNAFLGGWETTGIWTIMTGQPIYLSWASCGINIPTWGCQQPDLIGPLKRNNGPNWMQDYFSNDSQVLREPAPYTLGTGPPVLPNVFGPGTENADLAIYKNFALSNVREGMSLQLRLETENGLNRPQFGSPNTSFESGIFGLISSQLNYPRQLQLGAELNF
jgi:hypothetical protein